MRDDILGGRYEGSELLSSILCHVRSLCVRKLMANHQRLPEKEVLDEILHDSDSEEEQEVLYRLQFR